MPPDSSPRPVSRMFMRGDFRSLAAIVSVTLIAAAVVPVYGASWHSGGSAIAPSSGRQGQAAIAPDGSGGAFVSWIETGARHGQFAQHLTPTGQTAAGWPDSGRFLTRLDDDPMLAPDDAGGVYVASSAASELNPGLALVLYHLAPDGNVFHGWPAGGMSFYGEPTPAGTPFSVQGTHGNSSPILATSPDGGLYFVRTWTQRSPHADVLVTRLSATGSPEPGWSVNGVSVNEPNDSPWATEMVPDTAGGAFVSYSRLPILEGGGWLVHVRPNGGLTRCLTGFGDSPGTVADGHGGAFFFWRDSRAHQPYAQHIASNDSIVAGWPDAALPLGPAPMTPSILRNYYGLPFGILSAVSDDSGGAYMAWIDDRDSSGTGEGHIYAQHVTYEGRIAAGWPANGLAIATARGGQQRVVIAADGAGGMLLAWEDLRGGDADIYATRVTAAGVRAAGWPDQGLSVCGAAGAQQAPAIIADGSGGAIVAWVDERSEPAQIFAAHVGANGTDAALASLVSANATTHLARITWLVAPDTWQRFAVERRGDGGIVDLGSVQPDAAGDLTVEDPSVTAGARYEYVLWATKDGERYELSNVAVQIPATARFTLEGAVSNPVVGEAHVAFDLTDSSPTTLALCDLAGRRVWSRDVGALGTGRHVITVEGARGPGLYWVTLTRGGDRRVARICVLK